MTRGALLLLLTCLAGPASAQSMRDFTVSRQLTSATIPLRASLDFGAGRMTVQAGDAPLLYDAVIEYDTERFTPVHRYDERTGILRIGLEPVGKAGLRVTSWQQLDQSARFTFSPSVPLFLEANLGASEAVIDLARLNLRTLAVRSGATRSTIDVSTPTAGHCERATFSAGAGELRVLNFANAGCAALRLEGGAGRMSLDMGGEWRKDSHLTVSLAVGTLLIRVPRGVGVRITATDRALSRVQASGLERRGNVRESADFDSARYHLTIDLAANLADVQVEWGEK